jgi:hypothetical protein
MVTLAPRSRQRLDAQQPDERRRLLLDRHDIEHAEPPAWPEEDLLVGLRPDDSWSLSPGS